jgi:hypothetical protein
MAKLKDRPSAVRLKENEVTKEDVEREAYYHWLGRGCPEGDAMTDWVEAERKLSAQGDWMRN